MNYSKNFKNLILRIEKKKEKEKKVLLINKIIFFLSILIFFGSFIFSYFKNDYANIHDYYYRY
jgi:hypothetical protein